MFQKCAKPGKLSGSEKQPTFTFTAVADFSVSGSDTKITLILLSNLNTYILFINI